MRQSERGKRIQAFDAPFLGAGLLLCLSRLVAPGEHRYVSNGNRPEDDLWLVRTVGVLITIIGLVLLLAWWRRTMALEIAVLATGSAAALAAIDVYYFARRLLSPIYLADALAETALIAWWVFLLTRR